MAVAKIVERMREHNKMEYHVDLIIVIYDIISEQMENVINVMIIKYLIPQSVHPKGA